MTYYKVKRRAGTLTERHCLNNRLKSLTNAITAKCPRLHDASWQAFYSFMTFRILGGS